MMSELKPVFLSLLTVMFSMTAQAEQAQTLPRSDSSNIHYYLSIENEKPSDTLLVLIQGSDCNSVTKVEMIKEGLPTVAPDADLLTVEKYGITQTLSYDEDPERTDCPESFVQKDSISQRVDDHLKVISHVRSQHRYKNVYAVGGSEGALVANFLAQYPETVSKVVAFNGGGARFIDDLEHAIKSEITDKKTYTEVMQEVQEFTQYVLNSEPVEFNVSGHGFAWWREILELNQTDVLRKAQVPVLLVQAEKDSSVSVKSALEQFNLLKKEGKSNIEYLSLAGLDHAFNDKNGQSQVPTVIKDVQQWLESDKPK
ncbi:hypothetical protein CW749_08705 [Vibrio sp. vnigr-6D03]|uniref:alpha/beta hydrolase family protein n=1 Tax=Vibrio sp. vnigr-6D03 TaxID=2058088 RepID=UPI000C348B6E|nr:prolyl oligopeptidase family serine peptidase [Vibrio sp. vnigr-6D03]PKF79773.1 hypothetical protein CW749_08705 [Vibrio sp. vnigr-6D03]